VSFVSAEGLRGERTVNKATLLERVSGVRNIINKFDLTPVSHHINVRSAAPIASSVSHRIPLRLVGADRSTHECV